METLVSLLRGKDSYLKIADQVWSVRKGGGQFPYGGAMVVAFVRLFLGELFLKSALLLFSRKQCQLLISLRMVENFKPS